LQNFSNKTLITFPNVATHNHFVTAGSTQPFNSTAMVIELRATIDENSLLSLIGLLNSSTACFWIKQVFQTKGSSGIGRGVYDEAWERFYQINGTGLEDFPVINGEYHQLLETMKALSGQYAQTLPSTLMAAQYPDKLSIREARSKSNDARKRMIATQEELDWAYYYTFGLTNENICYRKDPPPIELGQRAFEIVIARRMCVGELDTSWFERHGSIPITEIPAEWPEDYRKLVERRIELIENDHNVGLIEQPEYKRRWNAESWEWQLEQALHNWLLDRLELYFDFDGRMDDKDKPAAKIDIALISTARLFDVARQDADFMQVGALYRNDPAFDVHWLVAELVEAESVPLLSVLRYKDSGLRKRREWKQTWDLQRQEDAIDARTKLSMDDPQYLTELQAQDLKRRQVGDIPVPSKYASSDFANSTCWRLRGKLDVPKERWISFPHCEGADGTLMFAWAGYDHLQLARAISAYYVDIQERLGGRDDPRLVPLLACLIELLPWLKQWHNDVDPEFGMRMGDYFEGFIQEEARQMGKTLDQITAWEPPKKTERRRRKTTT
jgi:hypothetical protein